MAIRVLITDVQKLDDYIQAMTSWRDDWSALIQIQVVPDGWVVYIPKGHVKKLQKEISMENAVSRYGELLSNH